MYFHKTALGSLLTELQDKAKYLAEFFVRILLVEDDPSLGETTARALRSQSWAVDWINNGESIPNAVRLVTYDTVVLDVGLPGIDGFEVLRRLRAESKVMPILMLTARDAVEDRVHGLQLGADDYLVKPFALTELLARIQALTRRFHARQHNELLFGSLRLDLIAKRAFLADKPVELLPREWAVLVYLLNNTGKVVSKEQILEAISGWDETPSGNAIEVYVSRLRSKLSDSGISIRAIRGFGYLVEESANDIQS
jgi:two-component system, OmpR family, response regulator